MTTRMAVHAAFGDVKSPLQRFVCDEPDKILAMCKVLYTLGATYIGTNLWSWYGKHIHEDPLMTPAMMRIITDMRI